MRNPSIQKTQRKQQGAITILVALMLLVLLTIASLGMSRNSLREIVSSGFTRQGAMARSVSDSGIEWSIHWLEDENAKQAGGSVAATTLTQLKRTLLLDPTLAGKAKDATQAVPTDYVPGKYPSADFDLPSPTGVTQAYTLGLTQMGKLPIADTSQGSGSGAFTPATGAVNKNAPDLWAVRSDAQVVQGGVTFVHAKEVWISTPVQ